MRCEVNEVFPVKIEAEGTVMDFVDEEFLFVMKDEDWTAYELNALKRIPLLMDFVYKYDIAIFLLTLEDAIDTSDFIFNVHDNEYGQELYDEFDKGSGFVCSLYLLDKDNIVKGRRIFQLSTTFSKSITDCLIKQRDSMYHEAEFQCNLEGLQATWEPFELQPMAVASETIK